ncbi:alpha-ketoglutarate-dependent dioxygenase AlkB family protein [Marinomonas transparens]|uniref:Alpha-ketoglutarate-dependent dioxygenase AlkB n=1 Tax=Marinomonas transparens TaxID=2795388 RepID=A0A934JTH8_9GAMM|nr:alpha-ketoglutarate-dependent dioxygenase AlkB [Marinomonas transparens]MBJ7538037.1 alpha-ketoglutarate-dependent dioxygenase AlkB [Marinomonas transparens]
MDLFRQSIEQPDNLLPKDGVVKYYGELVSLASADDYFNRLLTAIEWKNDEAVIYGKRIITKRKVAWYADHAFEYTYSNITKRALPWTSELLELKTLVEQKTGEHFNACLLNLYHDGSEGMAWHSDGEKDLKRNGAIASLSFGAERKFAFKHKASKETLALVLEHGSLLVMQGTTQTYWQHRLPPTKKVTEPRINLTFRTIVNDNNTTPSNTKREPPLDGHDIQQIQSDLGRSLTVRHPM